MTQATTTTGAIEMMSVFMMQERAPSQEEAEKMLDVAKKERKGWLGGRVVPPGRSQKGRFRLIQAFFEDDGGEVPAGMARLKIPVGGEMMAAYGISPRRVKKLLGKE
jgi:hypothetical protein